MESERRLRRGRFVLAIAVSAALVLSAPFIGFVRSWIRATFPGQYVRIIGGAIALIAFGAVIAALWRIRSHRVLRYSAIAASLAFATWYSLADSTGNPDADKLLNTDPLALLLGMLLDQHMQKRRPDSSQCWRY